MKTNRFGILLEKDGEIELIPWCAVESITAYEDRLCITLHHTYRLFYTSAPNDLLRSIFADRGKSA